MASVSLKHINKTYMGGSSAVVDFDLDIDDNEFFVIVGTSGCGKSTVLRLIAGIEDISSGELYMNGESVNEVSPKFRDVAMMFQNYELTRKTVRDNLEYGLKLRRTPSDVINKRVSAAAAMLGIENLLDVKTKKLTAEQRRRVELGRAIVRAPKVFLLDEPLHDLDVRSRIRLITDIINVHRRLNTTFVYATHDQAEALAMGTRIAVMKDGVLQQVGTPAMLRDHPANKFVACFFGSPQMNVFNARLTEENGELYASIGESNKVHIARQRAQLLVDRENIGKDVLLGIRPEDMYCARPENAYPESSVIATVDVTENLGDETILYLKVDGKEEYTVARVGSDNKLAQGDEIKVYCATDRAYLFDPVTELTLLKAPE